jgi:endonuclease/exonuclease/phosphatase family metal-dependent hydrolase
MTLNLWNTPADLERRLDAAAAEISRRGPDVLCLQEVLTLPDGGHVATALAQRVGMEIAIAGAFLAAGMSGIVSGLAILTRLPVRAVHELDLPGRGSNGNAHGALVAELVAPSGRPLVVATTHLAWGGGAEAARCAQVLTLDDFLHELPAAIAPGAITVLTGDFNCLPESDSVRFLTGLGAIGGRSTFWTDAWAVAGHGSGSTSGPDNPWAATTAAQVGITEPSRLPQRRIDFILVRDWVYGRPGEPLVARRAFVEAHDDGAGAPIVASDHWGVEADLWDPEP